MNSRTRIETDRLLLRKPAAEDAREIFSRYANDPAVTKYLSWPTHALLEETEQFLAFSDEEWRRWPGGPYLIYSRASGLLLGGTGLHFRTLLAAETGYVLARHAWGQGFATECLRAVIELAREIGVQRLSAGCHPENAASQHVLEKCGFLQCEPNSTVFPNLSAQPQLTLQFALDIQYPSDSIFS